MVVKIERPALGNQLRGRVLASRGQDAEVNPQYHKTPQGYRDFSHMVTRKLILLTSWGDFGSGPFPTKLLGEERADVNQISMKPDLGTG